MNPVFSVIEKSRRGGSMLHGCKVAVLTNHHDFHILKVWCLLDCIGEGEAVRFLRTKHLIDYHKIRPFLADIRHSEPGAWKSCESELTCGSNHVLEPD